MSLHMTIELCKRASIAFILKQIVVSPLQDTLLLDKIIIYICPYDPTHLIQFCLLTIIYRQHS